MKNASSADKLSNTDGKTDFASRVKSILSNSPLVKRRRSMSSINSQSVSSVVFGVPLDVLVSREGGDVPFIIRKVVEYIEEQGLVTEGVYRVNGNAKVIEKMKVSFDKVGDANFHGEDIAAIAGLLKLFLRELPEGIIPQDKVSQFIQIQQSHPHDLTPEALSQLRHIIHTLPPSNYATLKYLIRHLAKVAEYTDANKMTPVSLSIVFGPNIFHCGEGIAGLQLQGFSNSSVCRMVLFNEVLFEGVEQVVMRRRSSSSPAKPRPYSEHIAEKRFKQDQALSPIRNSTIDSTSDLERSYSEKSIDEAIAERSHGTVSPTSPAPLKSPTSSKSPPPRPPPPKFKTSPSKDPVPVIKPTNEAEAGQEEESPFHRQYAKRGLKYTLRSLSESDGDAAGQSLSSEVKAQSPRGQRSKSEVHPPQLGHGSPTLSSSAQKKANDEVLRPLQVSLLSSREDERMLRTPSPYSFMSSPGATPPTSPAITPRSSRVVNSVVEHSIQQYLFQPPPQSSAATDQNSKESPKADVYGLLLPKTSPLESKQPPVVKRRSSQDGKKLRNRKNALYAESSEESNDGVIEDMNVQVLSLSPEHNAGVVENRQGKLSELIAQFEESDGVGSGAGEKRLSSDSGTVEDVKRADDAGTAVKKRKPSNKAFELFENKGLMIGMVGQSAPRVSFASTTTTISPSPSPTSSPTHQTASPAHLRSEDITAVSKPLSTSTCGDEDVFNSPGHSNPHTPTTLSTTATDDVFNSPSHSHTADLDGIKRERMLEHAVLSRPKGPANRRRPTRTPTPDNTPEKPDLSPLPESSLSNAPTLYPIIEDPVPIAPEEQHAVVEGWREGVEMGGCEGMQEVDGGEVPDVALRSKELTQRIHVLKKEVRHFESEFVSTHGHKPSGEEKSPIRHVIDEVLSLKKQLKSLGASPQHEDRDSTSSQKQLTNSQTTCERQNNDNTESTRVNTPVHKDIDLTNNAPVSKSTTKPRRATVDSLDTPDTTIELVTKVDSRRVKSEGGEVNPLLGTLTKLMGGLATRRKSSGRPDELETMSMDELLQEKRDMQKALLQFERAHGRPSSREDKEIMRPLYDRYRLVKRLASTSGDTKIETPTRHSLGGLESTTDSLPSVTMLHSTSLAVSLPAAPEYKSVFHEVKVSDGQKTSQPSVKGKQVMSESQLKKATLDELLEQNKLLVDVKKDLRIKLKEFESKFQAEHGRNVQKEDRGQMQDEYSKYKDVKTKLKIVSLLMAKNNPQKTI